jgi:hypothetical protein
MKMIMMMMMMIIIIIVTEIKIFKWFLDLTWSKNHSYYIYKLISDIQNVSIVSITEMNVVLCLNIASMFIVRMKLNVVPLNSCNLWKFQLYFYNFSLGKIEWRVDMGIDTSI